MQLFALQAHAFERPISPLTRDVFSPDRSRSRSTCSSSRGPSARTPPPSPSPSLSSSPGVRDAPLRLWQAGSEII